MNRLDNELQRLYPPPGADGTRTLVLELAAPASWEGLSRVWQGVQVDLGLPAPGIAVSGSDACQLWFSLAEPLAPADAAAFLAGLRARYLARIPPERIRLHPAGAAGAAPLPCRPPRQVDAARWAAFVAPDLAALFSDDPSLDVAPTQDGQAELLSRLQSAQPPALRRALEQLATEPARAAPVAPAQSPAATPQDPRGFLLSVMNDPSIDLRLRIEAARALLPSAP